MTAATTSPTATRTGPSVGPESAAARAVAGRVEELAQRPALAGRRVQLESLAAALSDRDQADGWDAVDLHTALGHPVASDEEVGNRALRALNALAAARIGLVFVPVFVTWWAVHGAASRYHEALARNPDLAAQSFFRLWLDGFDGQWWLTFETMAMIIAVAVILIIVLSVGLEAVRSRHEFAAAQRQQQLQEELAGVLTEASVQLARGRPATPERFLDELTRAAEGLSAMVAQVKSAAAAATDAMQAAETATAAAQQAAAHAHDSVTELTRSADGLADGVASSAAAADAAATKVSNAVDGSVGRLAGTVEAVQETVAQVGARATEDRENIGTLLREHREDMGQLLPGMADQVAAAQAASLGPHLAELRTAMAGLAQAQQALATAIKRRRAVAAPQPAAGSGVRATLRRWLGG